MKPKAVHCLFEQSGTFKNEFKKLGYTAYDYDILNDFGQTDNVIDLFKEIRGGYQGEPSIFDRFSKDDLIIAFFPCVRFENQIHMHFQGTAFQLKGWSVKSKVEYDMKLHEELHDLYMLISKLYCLCDERGLKLIIENPYSQEHYLTRYWAVKPSLIDKDRSLRGDWYKKPTQYWFVNCEPEHNFIFEPILNVERKRIAGACQDGHHQNTVERSMIHPQYANRFIREQIIDEN